METQGHHTTFESDTLTGLSSDPKFLLSKYFYDARGSKIFEDIMHMPEYYLTDCELEIFRTHKMNIASAIGINKPAIEVVELGAGNGLKTKILLAHLLDQNINFKYIPIDISAKAVDGLQKDLSENFPDMKVEGQIGDYFKLLAGLNGSVSKVVLFLGSNIGNFDQDTALHFLDQLYGALNPGDQLLIGFDLKKAPEIILKAYNDPHGHTAAFNLNLLHRINRELDADFRPGNFYHQGTYDQDTGTAKSYLVSKKTQQVRIHKPGKVFYFRENEKIFMESSQKYDLPMIEALASRSQFEVIGNFYDSRNWFVNSLWRVNS